MTIRYYAIQAVLTAHMICYAPFMATAQASLPPDPEFDKILSLDIAELTVTSVTKTEQKANEAAAAIYVITQQDLHRAGITSIPEALRMVPGVQVAQTGSRGWAVSVRGFNNALANKLLVLIDGRSVYTPVYSGVYWDTQDTVIADIDRIEVIRGPGATLWGANAVNGVINIVTKKASATQGSYVSVSAGSKEHRKTEARYGGKIDNDTHYRLYAKEFYRGSLEASDGTSAVDEWKRARSGFRVDKTHDKDSYTVQGDVYNGQQMSAVQYASITSPFSQRTVSEDEVYGGNVITRWDHTISDTSSTSLQLYADHYSRDEVLVDQHITTLNVDFQHVLKPNARNELIWGGEYRYINQLLEGTDVAAFTHERQANSVLSSFIQNQYAVILDKVFFTLGSKFEYNDFTGFEIQPSSRVSWNITNKQMAWAAVSRAVRVPSRVEDDLSILALVTPGVLPNTFYVLGNENVDSEDLTAYEIGYRISPASNISIDVATFYNIYNNLVTIGSGGTPFVSGGTIVNPFTFFNDGSGSVYGAETAANWNVTKNWQLAAGYSYLIMNLKGNANSLTNFDSVEHSNPKHTFSLRSYMDLPHNVHWDNMLYYVHDLIVSSNRLHLPSNIRFDSQIGWEPVAGMELSLIGRNLFNTDHVEFSGSPTTKVGPTVLGTVAWRF
jgi:iron complex outermembrane recepter protein